MKDEFVSLSHGSGGRRMRAFLDETILPAVLADRTDALRDAAVLDRPEGRIMFTTDAFVVKPLEFPGGDIGSLAVSGTYNDLVVSGARPLYLSLALILEEGIPIEDVARYLRSAAEAAREAGVRFVTGDTKVVPRGGADGVYACTTGIGVEMAPHARQPVSGDEIILTGPLGDHAAAIIVAREEYGVTESMAGSVRSDAAPLPGLLAAWDAGAIWMRDVTRGGLASVAAEVAEDAGLRVVLRQEDIPIRPHVQGICDLTGFDPLHMACEGTALVVVPQGTSENVLGALMENGFPEAVSVGAVEPRTETTSGVALMTPSGTYRRLLPPEGELLPRIC